MTPLIIATALSLLALGAAPAAAQTTAVAPVGVIAPAKPAYKGDPYYNDAKICTDRPQTGSRILKRICITQAVKDEQDRRLLIFENRLGETVGFKPLDSNNAIPAN